MFIDVNKKVSIIAYYISKFDMDAVRTMGFDTYSTAFFELSKNFDKNNSYIRLRRDEFDAILEKTNRQGWNKRAPKPSVLLMHNDLKNYNFEELTVIVKQLIHDNEANKGSHIILDEHSGSIIKQLTEEEYESIINLTDPTATIKRLPREVNTRIMNNDIPKQLKSMYQHKCQICGASAKIMYGVDVSEAHHIDYFTKSLNNNAKNIIMLCPDHHRIVHKAHAIFNYENHTFKYENSKEDTLMYNLHL